MNLKKIGMGLLGSFVLLPSLSFAANTQTIREECFNQLKANISEIGTFEEAETEFKDLSYANLETRLSRSYKNLSSFGIDVDQPIFEQKVYSFGAQTGYVHPPFSPFPTYTKADRWEKPAKQNIFSEEYIKDEKGNLHFLSCGFIRIEAEDLMQVTSENYLYDGELISVLKTPKDESYKAWYNENTSYDHENKPFVSWQRLFVYPASSINSYFNRFSVADAFPSNPSDTLDLFKPKKPKVSNLPPELLADIKKQLGKENPTKEDIMSVIGDGAPRIYVADLDGQIKTSVAKKELMPVKLPENTVFGLKSYYDGIENYFPNFAKHLALRGSLKYETLKKIISRKDAPELAHIWSTVLDSRDITKYALKKERGEIKIDPDSFYEQSLKNIPKIEATAQAVLKEVEMKEAQKVQKVKITKPTKPQIKETPKSSSAITFYIIGGLLLILSLLFAVWGIKTLKNNKLIK